MKPNEYRDILETLGLTQVAAGDFLGYDPRTSRRWAAGDLDVPPVVEMLLRTMVRLRLTPDGVYRIAFDKDFYETDH
jgi:hypothetical protein